MLTKQKQMKYKGFMAALTEFLELVNKTLKDRGLKHKQIVLRKKDGSEIVESYVSQLLAGKKTMTLDYASQLIYQLGLKVSFDGNSCYVATKEGLKNIELLKKVNGLKEFIGFIEDHDTPIVKKPR